jgi:preprotein translocase subunit SecB
MLGSPLSLKACSFSKVIVEATTTPPAQKTDVSIALTVGLAPIVGDLFVMTLEVQFGPPEGTSRPPGYNGTVMVTGQFEVDATVPPKGREDFLKREGSPVLLSAAREMIASITARGPWKQFILPVTGFEFLIQAEPAEKVPQV